MQWVMKASKLCNLRCKYCYEWDHLADPARMSLEVWKHALVAIREYSELAMRNTGKAFSTDIIWHGGEPLILPVSYWRDVVSLQREIFSPEWFERGLIRNCVQTNLYAVGDGILDFLQENDFALGVSVDFAGGVRVTAAGKQTEAGVKQNLHRLAVRGLPFALITVLARHTIDKIDDVFSELATFGVPVRLLPLFAGPQARPMDGVAVSHREILDALMRLFDLWFRAGMPMPMDPFDESVKTVAMKRLGLRPARADRARLGNEVLVVDPEGWLSCVAFRDSRRIANVVDMPIADILHLEDYLSLVREEGQLKAKICDTCAMSDACDTRPLARNFDSHGLADCPTEKYLTPLIEAYLEDCGFFDAEFAETADDMAASHLLSMTGARASVDVLDALRATA